MAQHEAFKRHLRDSEGARWFVAQWFSRLGWTVTLEPLRVRKDWEDPSKYADNGDLHISRDNVKHVVEVKQALARDWTCADNWGFRDVMVCAKHSFDRAKPKPHAYIILNKPWTHVAVVMGAYHSFWTVKSTGDSRPGRGGNQEKYFCPIEHVKFMEIG